MQIRFSPSIDVMYLRIYLQILLLLTTKVKVVVYIEIAMAIFLISWNVLYKNLYP
jgi:hypothetical protein